MACASGWSAAIAISCQPSLLIADEPTTSLDVTIQAQYLRLLKDLQRQTNVALIFVTHDLGIVAKHVRPRRGDVRRDGLSRRHHPGDCSPAHVTRTPSASSTVCPR